jgi:hypothetical protein
MQGDEVMINFGTKGNQDPRSFNMLTLPLQKILLGQTDTRLAFKTTFANSWIMSRLMKSTAERFIDLAKELDSTRKDVFNRWLTEGFASIPALSTVKVPQVQ